MMQFFLVCLGGAVGSGARFLVATAAPHAVVIVNVIGSFLIAVAMESMRASDLRLMLVTGMLGGFTTYSAFNQETLQYARSGDWRTAAINVFVTLIACLIAGFVGVLVARRLPFA